MATGYRVGQLSSRRARDDSAVFRAALPGPEVLPVTEPTFICLLVVQQRQSLRQRVCSKEGISSRGSQRRR